MPEIRASAVSFPRISREVIDEMESNLNHRDLDHAVRLEREQPVLFDSIVGSFPLEKSALMIAAMGYLYEALHRQMRRGQ